MGNSTASKRQGDEGRQVRDPPSSSESLPVDQHLGGQDDYLRWTKDIKNHLARLNLYDALLASTENESADGKDVSPNDRKVVADILFRSILQSLRPRFSKFRKDPRLLWREVKAWYCDERMAYYDALISIRAIRLGACSGIDQYTNRFNQLRNKLDILGCKMSDVDYLYLFMDGLAEDRSRRAWAEEVLMKAYSGCPPTLRNAQFQGGCLPTKPPGFGKTFPPVSPQTQSPNTLRTGHTLVAGKTTKAPPTTPSIERPSRTSLKTPPPPSLKVQSSPTTKAPLPPTGSAHGSTKRAPMKAGTCLHRHHLPAKCWVDHPELKPETYTYDSYRPGNVAKRSHKSQQDSQQTREENIYVKREPGDYSIEDAPYYGKPGVLKQRTENRAFEESNNRAIGREEARSRESTSLQQEIFATKASEEKGTDILGKRVPDGVKLNLKSEKSCLKSESFEDAWSTLLGHNGGSSNTTTHAAGDFRGSKQVQTSRERSMASSSQMVKHEVYNPTKITGTTVSDPPADTADMQIKALIRLVFDETSAAAIPTPNPTPIVTRASSVTTAVDSSLAGKQPSAAAPAASVPPASLAAVRGSAQSSAAGDPTAVMAPPAPATNRSGVPSPPPPPQQKRKASEDATKTNGGAPAPKRRFGAKDLELIFRSSNGT